MIDNNAPLRRPPQEVTDLAAALTQKLQHVVTLTYAGRCMWAFSLGSDGIMVAEAAIRYANVDMVEYVAERLTINKSL